VSTTASRLQAIQHQFNSTQKEKETKETKEEEDCLASAAPHNLSDLARIIT